MLGASGRILTVPSQIPQRALFIANPSPKRNRAHEFEVGAPQRLPGTKDPAKQYNNFLPQVSACA